MGGDRVDTASPTARLMLTMLAAVAQFERELMLERQREGIAAAKAAGKSKGRAPTARRQAPEMRRLLAEGMSKSDPLWLPVPIWERGRFSRPALVQPER